MIKELLITGPEDKLDWYKVRSTSIAKYHGRWGSSDKYIVMFDNLDVAVRLGRVAGVTVQVGGSTEELDVIWPVHVYSKDCGMWVGKEHRRFVHVDGSIETYMCDKHLYMLRHDMIPGVRRAEDDCECDFCPREQEEVQGLT